VRPIAKALIDEQRSGWKTGIPEVSHRRNPPNTPANQPSPKEAEAAPCPLVKSALKTAQSIAEQAQHFGQIDDIRFGGGSAALFSRGAGGGPIRRNLRGMVRQERDG
jgi:hypothetical protein